MKKAKIKVTIWNENIHEKNNPVVRELYPGGLHGFLAQRLDAPDLSIRTATLEEAEHGLTEAVLDNTDVLIWWGHIAHHRVDDAIVERVQEKIWEGMGFIALHSGHRSKIFRRLNGTSCKMHWREAGERERFWVVDPSHPTVAGLPEHFELSCEEMYGEPLMIAEDAKVIMISWFEGGEVFRSAFTLQRGNGKIFYFQPGHETFPSFHDDRVIKVIANAVRWTAPVYRMSYTGMQVPDSLETISRKSFKRIQ
ncbi:MAG: ThuA domain-containing protein [Victivallales bacterium]|nr:ThuA domain-containing protein [Victivallales bacterium]